MFVGILFVLAFILPIDIHFILRGRKQTSCMSEREKKMDKRMLIGANAFALGVLIIIILFAV